MLQYSYSNLLLLRSNESQVLSVVIKGSKVVKQLVQQPNGEGIEIRERPP
jgi:hypothetical protein